MYEAKYLKLLKKSLDKQVDLFNYKHKTIIKIKDDYEYNEAKKKLRQEIVSFIAEYDDYLEDKHREKLSEMIK